MRILLILIVLMFNTNVYNAYSSDDKEQNLPTKSEILKYLEKDHFLGNTSAKVTMIEYSSLVCNHCADFHINIFPKIKENYIDSGKILYIHRDFATNKAALTAAALVNCSKNYFSFVDALFLSQTSWAFSNEFEKSLLNIAKLSGMEKDEFDQCLNNEQLRAELYTNTYQASKVLDVNATPVFFINGERIEGALSYEMIASKIDKRLIKN